MMTANLKLAMKIALLCALAISAGAFSVSPIASRSHTLSSVGARALLAQSDSRSSQNEKTPSTNAFHKKLKNGLASLAFGSYLLANLFTPMASHAVESQIIGQISGSGLVFKDTLEVERFEDPKIKGITLYITNFQRPITERLTTNFLQDPSYASVACVKTSPTVAVADNINTSPQGEEVFQENKSILFKTLRGKMPRRLG